MQRSRVEENQQQDSQDSWREAEETPLTGANRDRRELSGPTAAEKVPEARTCVGSGVWMVEGNCFL